MKFLLPYIQLARLDRPIGSWLLLLPCWWGLVVGLTRAEGALGAGVEGSEVFLFTLLFAVGAILMRGAGCTYNDLVDQNFDAQVQRTKTRPLPAGLISRPKAIVFLCAQLVLAALVLFQFNTWTIVLGVGSLALVVIYPFMKRITMMPQFFLGLAFSWGVWLGGASVLGASVFSLDFALLYLASIFWVIAYDTIYALQDKEADLLVGLKSSALLFAGKVHLALAVLFGASILFLLAFGIASAASIAFYTSLLFVAAHFIWQVQTLEIDNSQNALRRFQSNRDGGLIILTGLLANQWSFVLSANT